VGNGGDTNVYPNKVEALMADERARQAITPGHWMAFLYGPPTVGITAFNADGFLFEMNPDGQAAGNPVVVITYKLEPIQAETYAEFSSYRASKLVYNDSAGYEVYHYTRT
jgi:hypothetical protein